jgi:hypothetical protein
MVKPQPSQTNNEKPPSPIKVRQVSHVRQLSNGGTSQV